MDSFTYIWCKQNRIIMKNHLFILAIITSLNSFSQTVNLCKTPDNTQYEYWCDSLLNLKSYYGVEFDTVGISQLDKLEMYVSVQWIQMSITHESLTGNGSNAFFFINSNPVPEFQFNETGLYRIKISTVYDGEFGFMVSVDENQLLSIHDNYNHKYYGEFEYYNLMGQKVVNPKGICLKVYENGNSKKVFIQ